ncbi:hypothetical protein DPEC_G00027600 [Dallia pectoralis]|uniref:Uncharacterized protein n=1 Tax=Dallia pectoralis TaxID=75939 RepID=A0ACC2HHW1_DALPE|nr:hypothetical protein DPEC_G00027600 [Dallia pectoralis]
MECPSPSSDTQGERDGSPEFPDSTRRLSHTGNEGALAGLAYEAGIVWAHLRPLIPFFLISAMVVAVIYLIQHIIYSGPFTDPLFFEKFEERWPRPKPRKDTSTLTPALFANRWIKARGFWIVDGEMWRYQKPGFMALLLAELQRQQSGSQFCDTVLRADGVSVPTHSCVLSALSPQLSRALASSSTTPPGQSRLLEFQAFGGDSLLKLVGLLYSGEMMGEGEEERQDAITAAAWLGIQGLVEVGRRSEEEVVEVVDDARQSTEVKRRQGVPRRDMGVQTEPQQGLGAQEKGRGTWRREHRGVGAPAVTISDRGNPTEDLSGANDCRAKCCGSPLSVPLCPNVPHIPMSQLFYSPPAETYTPHKLPSTILMPSGESPPSYNFPPSNPSLSQSTSGPEHVSEGPWPFTSDPPEASRAWPSGGAGLGHDRHGEAEGFERFEENLAGFISHFLDVERPQEENRRGWRKRRRRAGGSRRGGTERRPRSQRGGSGAGGGTKKQGSNVEQAVMEVSQRGRLWRWGVRACQVGRGGGVVGSRLHLKPREVMQPIKICLKRRGRGNVWEITGVEKKRGRPSRRSRATGRDQFTQDRFLVMKRPRGRPRRSTVPALPTPSQATTYERPSSPKSPIKPVPYLTSFGDLLHTTSLPPAPLPPQEDSSEQLDRLLDDIMGDLDFYGGRPNACRAMAAAAPGAAEAFSEVIGAESGSGGAPWYLGGRHELSDSLDHLLWSSDQQGAALGPGEVSQITTRLPEAHSHPGSYNGAQIQTRGTTYLHPHTLPHAPHTHTHTIHTHEGAQIQAGHADTHSTHTYTHPTHMNTQPTHTNTHPIQADTHPTHTVTHANTYSHTHPTHAAIHTNTDYTTATHTVSHTDTRLLHVAQPTTSLPSSTGSEVRVTPQTHTPGRVSIPPARLRRMAEKMNDPTEIQSATGSDITHKPSGQNHQISPITTPRKRTEQTARQKEGRRTDEIIHQVLLERISEPARAGEKRRRTMDLDKERTVGKEDRETKKICPEPGVVMRDQMLPKAPPPISVGEPSSIEHLVPHKNIEVEEDVDVTQLNTFSGLRPIRGPLQTQSWVTGGEGREKPLESNQREEREKPLGKKQREEREKPLENNQREEEKLLESNQREKEEKPLESNQREEKEKPQENNQREEREKLEELDVEDMGTADEDSDESIDVVGDGEEGLSTEPCIHSVRSTQWKMPVLLCSIKPRVHPTSHFRQDMNIEGSTGSCEEEEEVDVLRTFSPNPSPPVSLVNHWGEGLGSSEDEEEEEEEIDIIGGEMDRALLIGPLL